MVADEHELAARVLDPVEELGQVARRDHAGFVDDEDRLIGETLSAAPELSQERGHARALNAGALLELAGSAPRYGDSEHRVPSRLPGVACRGERVRLARAGLAGNDGHTVTVETEPPNELLLLRRQRRS